VRSEDLPYVDAKPVGAADFYFAVNATFRFVLSRFGIEGLRRYWSEMGATYYAPVTDAWRRGGLEQVARYWSAFFRAEPGAVVQVNRRDEHVELRVEVCPAIRHLRDHGREIVPCFCQHCFFVSEAIARPAGFTVRVEGGNGSCRQLFLAGDTDCPPQELSRIEDAQ
jgi:hypothetical protein